MNPVWPQIGICFDMFDIWDFACFDIWHFTCLTFDAVDISWHLLLQFLTFYILHFRYLSFDDVDSLTCVTVLTCFLTCVTFGMFWHFAFDIWHVDSFWYFWHVAFGILHVWHVAFGIWHFTFLTFDSWHLMLFVVLTLFDIWHLTFLTFDIWHLTFVWPFWHLTFDMFDIWLRAQHKTQNYVCCLTFWICCFKMSLKNAKNYLHVLFLHFWNVEHFWLFTLGLRNQALEAQGTRGGPVPQGTRGARRPTQPTGCFGTQ